MFLEMIAGWVLISILVSAWLCLLLSKCSVKLKCHECDSHILNKADSVEVDGVVYCRKCYLEID